MNRFAVAATLGASAWVAAGRSGAEPPLDLKAQGAFGFPQGEAIIIRDTESLRVSAWNDASSLYVQAVLWTDGDEALGETPDGRKIGDCANLEIDADADGKVTANLDRSYMLNPWPTRSGLRYSVQLGGNASTPIRDDSKGRGAIRYVETPAGKVRVDSFVIPLFEIKRKPGEPIRFAYHGSSPQPDLTLNSVGFSKQGKYYAFHLPRENYHELTLADRPTTLMRQQVPEGREDDQVALEQAPVKPKPQVGTAPPEVVAADWLNIDRPPTLAALLGKVVVVEFWATWCAPCVAGIPHLNKLHDDLGPDGLVILSLTDQSKAGIATFLESNPMRYVIGAGSETAAEYGVEGIPHAFLIGKDGKLIWQGHPADEEFDRQIAKALKAK